MELINTILGTPLGFVIHYAYMILGSFGLAILFFAVAVKIILMPVMALAHRNSIRLLQLQPKLHRLKIRFSGDRNGLSEAQYELFKQEKYSPLLGILPLIIQLFLVIGMLQVMYHPLQHVYRLDSSVIETLVLTAEGITGVTAGFAAQLVNMEVFQNPAYFPLFDAALYGNEAALLQVREAELEFLGFNLAAIPSFADPSVELVIILFSGIAALAFCLVQNAISPGALSQSRNTNVGLILFTVGLSLYFAWALPVGVGIYWTVGNFAAIGAVLALNAIYPPRKLAKEALEYLEGTRKTKEEIQKEKMLRKKLKAREKVDASAFKNAKKQLVFYALTGGQYRFYKEIIDFILANSDVKIHYLTNDPNDGVFKLRNERFIPYYASERKTIPLFLKLDADILATTVPDLQVFHMKRSVARDDIEYIFIPHTIANMLLVMRGTSCDYFDTVLCVGPQNVAELRAREQLSGLRKKKLIKAGYGLHDQLARSFAEMPNRDKGERGAHAGRSMEPNSCVEGEAGQPGMFREGSRGKTAKILIAPSWQDKNILESCIGPLLNALLGNGHTVTIRPHPQFIKLFPERIKNLQESYAKYVSKGELRFGLDISDNESVFESDTVITDWSNIGFEFAYATLRPCIFINTPMKIMNPDYELLGCEITDITFRDKLGVSVDVENVTDINGVLADLHDNGDSFKGRISETISKYLYHPGRNGEAGGRYILNQLK